MCALLGSASLFLFRTGGQWVAHQQALGQGDSHCCSLSCSLSVVTMFTSHLALLSCTEIFEFVVNSYLSMVRLFTHFFTTFKH